MSIKIGLAVRTHEDHYVVNPDYVRALRKAGADPVILIPESRQGLSLQIKQLDGILIPGGWDIDPKHYKEELNGSVGMDDAIDALDIDLIQLANAYRVPIFGICRGLQAINVALGGSLYQDIPSMVVSAHDHSKGKHTIDILPESNLALLLPKTVIVNSFHHQGIKHLAPLLRIAATSDDGIIEAIEGDKIMAVQWHPERMIDEEIQFALFQYFVEICKK